MKKSMTSVSRSFLCHRLKTRSTSSYLRRRYGPAQSADELTTTESDSLRKAMKVAGMHDTQGLE